MTFAELINDARGIGEIGLDPKYGQMDNQEYLLNGILSLAESSGLPLTFHCRETTSKILDKLASYNLRQNIMFHWFSGSETGTRKNYMIREYSLHLDRQYYSQGEWRELVISSDRGLILVETDSPTTFQSIMNGPSTPFLVYSVAFKMALIMKMPFKDLCDLVENNESKYLLTQD